MVLKAKSLLMIWTGAVVRGRRAGVVDDDAVDVADDDVVVDLGRQGAGARRRDGDADARVDEVVLVDQDVGVGHHQDAAPRRVDRAEGRVADAAGWRW